MKKTFLAIALIIGLVLIINYASAETINSVNYTTPNGGSGIYVTQLEYTPYPVNPGEYFDLWIQAQHVGSGTSRNATFVLEPTFPFSLDPNQSAAYSFSQIGATPVLLHYKIRVDKNAVEGNNNLSLKYTGNAEFDSSWLVKTFNISVANAQTNFDLVVQESTGSQTSIAIANTGENTANSLIVRIPSQPGFRTEGTNGQMVGNLASGDYSIVSFNIVPVRNSAGFGGEQNLSVEMDYTDNIGVRRSVIKTIQFTPSFSGNFTSSGSGATFQRGSFSRAQSGSSSSIFTSIWFWIVVVLIAGFGFFYYKKHPDEVKNLLNKLKSKEKKAESQVKKVPDWVSSERKKTGR